MGTPQLEDGHVRIANALLEAILVFGFSQRELLVLLTIIRKTYGFNKKADDMSASQIGALCGVARQHVTTTLNGLAARNVITKTPGEYGMIIGIQKDHRKWVSTAQIGTADSPESGLVPNQDMSQIGTGGSPESGQVDSPDSGHTKDNLPKDNHQKTKSCAPDAGGDAADETPAGRLGRAKTGIVAERRARFDRFYDAYPRKRSRGAAEKAFAKINPDDETVDLMLAAVARLQQSGEWTDPKFIPHPATWLNASGWLDQVQTAYTADEVEVIEAFNGALGEQLGVVALAPFAADRAAAIRDFRTFSDKPGFVERFFPWLRTNATFPPSVGFDWVISRKGYANLTSGQHSRKAA
jgi:phage replication O-like protein O